MEGEKIFREIERKKMALKLSLVAANNNGRARVGKYELGRTLGKGNFAKVKFARNVDIGENVATKILDKEKILKHKMITQVLIVILNFHSFFRIVRIRFFFFLYFSRFLVRFIDSISRIRGISLILHQVRP